MMRVHRCLLLALVVAAGCPGRGTKGATAAGDGTEPGGEHDVVVKGSDGQQDLVSADTLDAITMTFKRRGAIVSKCYADAVYGGKLKKTAQGNVTIALHISKDGRPSDVRVTGSTLGSQEVGDCIVGLVTAWDLPNPEADTDFSYTYNFLAE
jgi:hypothetical protein